MWHYRDVGLMLQLAKYQSFTTRKLFSDIVLTQWSDCQCIYQLFTNSFAIGKAARINPRRFRSTWQPG